MKDKEKSKGQLLSELETLRRELNELKSKGEEQSQESLHENEEPLKGILSSLHETVIVILDREGKHLFVWAPPELDKRYGICRDELVGKRLTDLFPAPETEEKIAGIQHIFETGEPHRMEYLAHLPGGDFWHDISFSPLRDSKGKVSAVVGFIRDITVQKKAEERLRESEKRHRTLFDTSPDGIVIATMEGKILDANQAFQDMLGYTLEELKDMKYQQFTPEKWHKKEQEAVKSFISGKGYGYFEKEYVKKDGTIFPISLTGWLIKDRQGNPEKMGVFVRDITEQKKAEEAYRALVENSLQGLGIAQDNKVIFVNSTIAEMLGYSIHELMSFSPKDWKRVIHPEDQDFVFGRLQDRLQGKPVPQRYELRMMRKDGQVIWVELFSSCIKFNGKPAIQAAFMDITERKKAEEALKQSERDYRGLFESAHDAIVVFDPDSEVVLDVNQRACDVYGLERGKFIGMLLTAISKDINRGKKHIKTTLDKGSYYHFETVQYRKDHSEMYLEINASVVYYKGKRAILSINRDITDRKKAEEKLRSIEQEKATILNSMAEHVVYQDKEQKVVWANRAAGESVGLAPDELVGRHCYEIWQKCSEPCQNCPVSEAVRTGEPHRAEMTSTDGRVWVINGNPVRDVKGDIVGAVEITLDITERKKAEEGLKQSEKKYRQLIENAQEGIWAIDKDSCTTFVNPRAAEMLGYSVEEMQGKHLFSFMDRRGVEICKQYLKRRKQGIKEGHDFEFLKKDGTRVYTRLEAAPITDDEGNYSGAIAFIADITDRKRAEQTLRETNECLRTLIDSIPDVIYFKDAQGRNLVVNKAFEELVGLTQKEIVGKTDDQLLPPDLVECCRKSDRAAMKNGKPLNFEEQSKAKDGKKIFFDTVKSPLYDEHGKTMGLVGVSRDITERKKAEEALRESEEKFRNLAEQSPNMIFLNKKGKVVYANKKCEEITGYKREEFYSPDFDFLTLISSEFKDLIKANFKRHLKGEECAPCEYRIITKEGKIIDGILTTKLVKYEGERAILGTVTDITERKKMQEELLKAKKLESIGILAGGIAHDFNNILTGILGNISLAKTEVDSKHAIFKILTKAEKASLRAKDLTQQLLTFSKGGAPIKKTTSIAELIEDSVSFALRGSKTRCEFSIPDKLWPCHIDSGQVSQVINNLIINGDQAMPEGGIIKVSAENVKIGAKDALSLEDGKYVKITIQDQGIGIPKEYLQKIFDPYFTTKRKGNGLGLSTSYSIIKNHNGCIIAESKLGAGSIFSVFLPASRAKIRKKKPLEQTPLAGEGRILVMDDEEVVREVVGDLLRILGYEVEFAKDGEEMIELYKMTKESGQSFDAVIMDLTVPGGMGGKESIQKLKQIDPEVKAIVSSGYSNDPVMSDFGKYGFSGVVAKPFKIEDLSAVLHKVVMGTSKIPV